MKRCPPLVVRSVTIAALLLVAAVSSYAQLQTGNIYGKVQARDGLMLPGVTVVLSGQGAPQTFITDSQGNFRFINLSPGAYALNAELAGYGTALRQGVSVRIGQNADVTISLSPSVSESITVTAEAPLLDTRKAGTAINVNRMELDAIPTSRDPWTILQQSPAVQIDRMNVGGNQSGQQSVYIGKGSGSRENTWNVDGVNITDNAATGSSPAYYDFDTFEEMQITTGGSDPRIQTPGVQLNLVTKRGTNDFKGSGRYFYTPGSYQDDPDVPEEATEYLAQANAINFVRDYGVELGGPIWRDRLWFWGARGDNKISNQGALSPGGDPAFDNIILRNKNAKINAQIASSNSAVGTWTFSDKVRNARSIGPTRPFETAWRQAGPGDIYKIEDTQIIGSTFYVTGMYAKSEGTGFSLTPNGGVGPSAPPGWRDVNNVWHNTFSFYLTDRPQEQYRLDGSKFLDVGNVNNELKFGFGYRDVPTTSSSGWPGPAQGYTRYRTPAFCAQFDITDPSLPNCAQFNLFRDSNKSFTGEYTDLYIGDTILFGNLTIQAGLRYDKQNSKNTASSSAPNPVLSTPLTPPLGSEIGDDPAFLPGLDFPGDTQELEWTSISPRIGFTYALGSDKKTLLRAGYNRYVSQIGATAFNGNPLSYYSYFITLGSDLNNDRIAQREEIFKIIGSNYVDPSNPGAIAGTTRLDYDMEPPHSDEIIIGAEREVFSDFSLGVNFTYRRYENLLMQRYEKTQGGNDFYTSDDFEVVGTAGGSIVDEETSETLNYPTVPVWGLKEGRPGILYSVITNRPDYEQTYNGLELVATKRLANRWMMRANVSYNDWKEDAGDNAFQDPTPRVYASGINTGCVGNCDGQVVEQSRGSGGFGDVFLNSKWSFNVTGLYQLPWDISLGASVAGRQGYPQVVRDEVETNTEPSGFKQVLVEEIGDSRFPNVIEVDLRVAKDFRIANRLGLTVSADLFNVANRRTILQRQTLNINGRDPETELNVPAGDANNIRELQSPRVFRFGARFNF